MGSPVISFCKAPIERAERVSLMSFLNGDALDFRERQRVAGTIIKRDAARPVTMEKTSTLYRPAKV
jgi:hypothetical protein